MQVRRVFTLWVALVALAAFSASARDDAAPAPELEPFVELEGLQGNVDFRTSHADR